MVSFASAARTVGYTECAAPPEAPTDPVGTVRTDNDAAGIVVSAWTATPDWQGERLDVGYAIDVLHPLAR